MIGYTYFIMNMREEEEEEEEEGVLLTGIVNFHLGFLVVC